MPVFVSELFIGAKSEEVPFRKRCRLTPSRPEAQNRVDRIAQELGIPLSNRVFTLRTGLKGYFLSKSQRIKVLAKHKVIEEPEILQPDDIARQSSDISLKIRNHKASDTPINDIRCAFMEAARECNMSIKALVAPINKAINRFYTVAENLANAAMEEKVRAGLMTEGGTRTGPKSRPGRRRKHDTSAGDSEARAEHAERDKKRKLAELMKEYANG